MEPLQMCAGGMDFADHMANFEFVKAVSCTYINAASMGVVALLVYTAVGGSIYIRTGSLVIPFGLLLLTGGAVMSQMAAVATPFVVLLVLVVPAGSFAYLYYRFSR